MGLGILGHFLNFLVAQSGAGLNLDGLLLAGAEVLCRDVQNAVGVNIKGNLNLRNASWCRRNIGKLESAERAVVSGKFPFALKDVDVNGGLTVSGGRENFLLAGRDCSVAFNQSCHNSAQGLDTQ